MTPVKQLFVQFLKTKQFLSIIAESQEEANVFLTDIAPELKEDCVLFYHSDHEGKTNIELMEAIKSIKKYAEISSKRLIFAVPKMMPIYYTGTDAVIEVERVDLGDALFGLGKVAFDVKFIKCRGYICDGYEGVTLVK